MKTFCIAFFSILLFATASLRAQLPPGIYSDCDFCMCSMGISPLAVGGSSIRLDSRYTELSQQYSNGVRVANPSNLNETYFTNVLSITDQVADELSAMLMVPFAHKVERSVDPAGGATSISNSGVGDLSMLVRYNLVNDHQWADMRMLTLTSGVKFANGSTTLVDNGQPADPDIQLGTGTTDFYAGACGMLGFGGWNIEADALALIRGFGTGASGHSYGDNLNYDVMGTYRIYQNASFIPSLTAPSAFVDFGIRGEWRGYEKQDGQPLDNEQLGWSGGNVLYATPGFQLFFAPRVSLDASVWLPFVHALHGDQLGETIKGMAGVQFGL